jgi:hypothetical protein
LVARRRLGPGHLFGRRRLRRQGLANFHGFSSYEAAPPPPTPGLAASAAAA